mmetsp:Transcript_18183/g.32040  ORF Transcript_18183/g.32040 Transcript_18183/m.32040 type:complete len:502 (+) Transcript_18183:84-1589(+)
MAPIKSFVGKFTKAAFTVAAPRSSSSNSPATDTNTAGTSCIISTGDISSFCLEKMCKLFKAAPVDNLYLSTGEERGVCLHKPVEKGGVVLSIPIESCFRDDEPPRWYERAAVSEEDVEAGGDTNNNNGDDNDITDYERYNPSAWASRLTASLLDMELNQGRGEINADDDLTLGREIWQSLLPDKDRLRASLPVHWGEEVLATSKCTALELAVDSAYFARATAVMNLSEELQRALDCNDEGAEVEMLERKCHNALDIVQTRACRVERKCEDGVQWGPPLRILAPIFDFINHGSSRTKAGDGSANASFGIENELTFDMHNAKLVVRASRDILEGEEVLIDYGDSARPAWRCLTSYGFVPEYNIDLEIDTEEEEQNVEHVAELWMNGLRFEVDPHSVPFDLVEVAAAQALLDQEDDDEVEEEEEEEDNLLTPYVARAIAKRATEAAFHLITEPEMVDSEEDWDSPELVHAASLAGLLRWSQHRVLLAFADNLKLFSSSPSEEAE